MEDFVFPLYDQRNQEYADLLKVSQENGDSYIVALENMLAEIRSRYGIERTQNGNISDECQRLHRLGSSVKEYLNRRKWFDRIGREPRTRIDEYDFKRFLKRIKNKPLTIQKDYWETVLLEVEEFVLIDRTIDTFGIHQGAKNSFIFDVKQELSKLKHELSIAIESTLETTKPIEGASFDKIKWDGNINVLVTLFYELHHSRKLDTTKTNLADWIVASFVDKNGKAIKRETIEMYLREDQEHKRVEGKKKIHIDRYIQGIPD